MSAATTTTATATTSATALATAVDVPSMATTVDKQKHTQGIVDALFWEALDEPRSGFTGLMLLAKRVSTMHRGGNFMRILHKFSERKFRHTYLQSLNSHQSNPTCTKGKNSPKPKSSDTKQQVASLQNVRFDARRLDAQGKSYIWKWIVHLNKGNALPSDVMQTFQLIKQNGGVTLAHMLAVPVPIFQIRGVNAYGIRIVYTFYLPCVSNLTNNACLFFLGILTCFQGMELLRQEPELHTGWNNICCESTRTTPLSYHLRYYHRKGPSVLPLLPNAASLPDIPTAEKALIRLIDFGDGSAMLGENTRRISQNDIAASIVPMTDDETINAIDSDSNSALYYAVSSLALGALYKLLCRPSLDMNPVKSVFQAMKHLYNFQRRQIIAVFDDAAAVFADVPCTIDDSIYASSGRTLSIAVCEIIAHYYRLRYPVAGADQKDYFVSLPFVLP